MSRTALKKAPRPRLTRVHGLSPARVHGFTLLEVLLAIGLSTIVLLILTTAIHQFLSRTDSSHGEVETSQLARALLNRMADDIRMARVTGFAAGSQATPTGGQNGPDSEQNNSPGELGLVGTATEVRFDRAAAWRWDLVPEVEPTDAKGSSASVTRDAYAVHPPETVRYFLREGDAVSTAKLAKMGIQEMAVDSIAGLCLERWTTALSRTSSADASATSESVPSQVSQFSWTQLLAPEVIELAFAYADGAGELWDQWDSTEQGALPRAIEIQLVLRKASLPGAHESAQNRVQSDRPEGTLHRSRANTETYRLVVQLPDVQPPRPPTTNSQGNSMNSSRSTDSSNSANSSDSGGSSGSEGNSSRSSEGRSQ